MEEKKEKNEVDKPITGKTNPVNAYVIGLSVISVFFSFAAFYAYCISGKPLVKFDTQTALWFVGVAISIIGILVTLVVIGNYSQVRDVKDEFQRKIEELKTESANSTKKLRGNIGEAIKELKEENLNTEKELKDNIQLEAGKSNALMFSTMGQVAAYTAMHQLAVELFFKSIDSAKESNENDMIDGIIDRIFNELKQMEKKGISAETSDLHLQFFREALMGVNGFESDERINYIAGRISTWKTTPFEMPKLDLETPTSPHEPVTPS